METERIKQLIYAIIILVLIVGGGLFALNQFFSWHYKSYLLQKPCQLCIELNPNFTRCEVVTNNLNKNYKEINWSDLKIAPKE